MKYLFLLTFAGTCVVCITRQGISIQRCKNHPQTSAPTNYKENGRNYWLKALLFGLFQ